MWRSYSAPMRTLAIECATEACSVALFDNDEPVAHSHEVLGRSHAERLVPIISALPDRGSAERILVSLGPGSFTGVRIGIATARALGIAWNAEVVGYPTLALVAAGAKLDHPAEPVAVCMTGGHGEWFVQTFGADLLPIGGAQSMAPEEAAQTVLTDLVVGSQAEKLVEMRGHGTALVALPHARNALVIPLELLSETISPIYGRAPDASIPEAVR